MSSVNRLRVERNPAPIRAQVVDKLRQAILDRQFPPGSRLIERELVELTGVSRTSVREALRELAAEGLVTSIPNKGMVVTTVTPEEARELYELRSALEGLAARLFVRNASEVQRKALVRAFHGIERAANRNVSILQAKDDFYEVLFAGAGNNALRTVIAGLHARVSVLRSLSLSLSGRAQESVRELRVLIDAIEADDADAAAAACQFHVEQAGRNGLALLLAEQEDESG